MTIWINNPFDFLPGEGARLQRYGLLAQALINAGHQVVWWSSDWNHIKKEVRSQKAAVSRSGLEIRLIRTMPYFKNVGVRRLISHWLYARSWKKTASSHGENEDEKPDLIICSAPPLSTGWVMRGICKQLGCVGVIDVMDVWPETFERVAPAWMLWPLRWMAKCVYESADGISAVGDSYLKVVKKYLEAELPLAGTNTKPLYRCYHGIEMQGEPENWKLETEAPLRLVYVGNMGKGYDLVTLVEAVNELNDAGYAIRLDLAGMGEQEENVQLLARTKKDSIRFHGLVTGDALCTLIKQADVGVVPMFENTYVAVPYKLADYAVAGVPVISSLKGETEELIKRYDAGWYYDAGDVLSLKHAIQACSEEHQTPSKDLRKQRARKMVEENFDAGKIYPEFVTWLEKLVETRGITEVK